MRAHVPGHGQKEEILEDNLFEFEAADFGLEDIGEEADAQKTEEEEPGAEESEENPEGEQSHEGEEGREDPEAEEDPDAGEEPEGEEKPAEDFSLEVKFRGELKKLNREELKDLAEKGLSFEASKERLSKLENERKIIDDLAKISGQDTEEFLKGLGGRIKDAQIKARAQELIKEDGVPEDKAEALAKKLLEKEQAAQPDSLRIQALEDENLQHRAREAAMQKWADFTGEHPEIKDYDSLPEEVREAVKAGKDLTDAYNAYELKSLKEQMKKAEKVKDNKKKSPGSAKDKEGGEQEKDDFLKGFLGGY